MHVGARWHEAAPFAAAATSTAPASALAAVGTTAVAAPSLTRGALVPAFTRRTAAVVAAGGAVVAARSRGGVDVARFMSTSGEKAATDARARALAAARTQQALALDA